MGEPRSAYNKNLYGTGKGANKKERENGRKRRSETCGGDALWTNKSINLLHFTSIGSAKRGPTKLAGKKEREKKREKEAEMKKRKKKWKITASPC